MRGENKSTRRKTSRGEKENHAVTVNDKLNLHMASTPRFDHLPRWREKSVVTNAPPLLPFPVSWVNKLQLQCIYVQHVALIFQYIKDGP